MSNRGKQKMRTKRGEPRRFLVEVALPHQGQDCVIWPFNRDRQGYAMMRDGEKMVLVSRLVCREVRGDPATPDHQAAHECGNGKRGGVSPNHLFWKTRKENAADKNVHGTSNVGERNGRSKLNENDVREIMGLKGKETLSTLSERFGVSRNVLSQIHLGRRWTHVFSSPDQYGSMK